MPSAPDDDPRPIPPDDPPITRLLAQARSGDEGAGSRVYHELYSQLHALARGVFQARGGTLQPTALIHEAWMKLAQHDSGFRDRQHFLATACLAMRQVMADAVRSQERLKRGGGRQRVTLHEGVLPDASAHVDVVELHDALHELERLNERHAKVVSMRIFGGMTIKEVGKELGVSHGTVESDWSLARAWLRRRLTP